MTLEAGDFVLLPATPGFTMSSFEPVKPERIDPKVAAAQTGEVRHGTRGGRPDVRLLGGWFVFDSPDSTLLVSLLPSVVHVHRAERLSVLVRLVGEEAGERRAGRDLVLTRLVEVLLVEALRSTSGEDAPPGLLRGFADAQLASAMRQMHGQLARAWTVAQLAKTAALSRSAFFDRFTRTVGLPPMEYLLAWRMAVAKDLLRRHDVGLAEVAERVGYGSASTFSTAFSRHVGRPRVATRASARSRLLQSAEREGERRHASIEELDLELSIDDRLRLSDQLIQPRFDHRAGAAVVHVEAVSRTRRLPVNRHAETHRVPLPRRTHDEMKVTRVKPVHDPTGGAAQDGCLPAHRPLANQRPFIERQATRGRIEATPVQFATAG